MKKAAIVFMAVCALSVQVQAMYVDASTSNTINAATGSASDWWVAANAVDGKWGLRSALGNNDDFLLGTPGNEIFEASGTFGKEDCMAIVTTASGLTAGQLYEVSVIYWSPEGSVSWNVRAGFSLDNMTLYERSGTLGGIIGTWTGKQEADRKEFSGLIGQIAADTNGQIQVYIDDLPANSSSSRSWYDGIVLTPVPEPTTCVLLVLGGILSLRRRG